MPRYIVPPEKTPELQAAEAAGANALAAYFQSGFGVQAQLSRDTGIAPPALSRMSKGTNTIMITSALLIEVATKGALPAELLCPSKADLLSRFMLTRAAKVEG